MPPCSVQAGREEYADATGQMPFRSRAEVTSFFDLLRQVRGIPPVRRDKVPWLLPRLSDGGCGAATTADPPGGQPAGDQRPDPR